MTAIARQLIRYGRVRNSHRAALNVQVTTVTSAAGQPAGAGVVAVTPGGAAARAGIRPGDVITAVNGTRVTSAQALASVLAGLRVGQTVTVTVDRGGSTHSRRVRPGQLG